MLLCKAGDRPAAAKAAGDDATVADAAEDDDGEDLDDATTNTTPAPEPVVKVEVQVAPKTESVNTADEVDDVYNSDDEQGQEGDFHLNSCLYGSILMK